MKLHIFLLPALIAISCAAFAGGPVPEDRKIDMLIDYVRTLNGAVFIRNGTEYAPAQAAAHLSLKRKKAGNRIKSAADFIELVAAKSYITGIPYTVRMPDGKIVTARELLYRRLKEIEQAR